MIQTMMKLPAIFLLLSLLACTQSQALPILSRTLFVDFMVPGAIQPEDVNRDIVFVSTKSSPPSDGTVITFPSDVATITIPFTASDAGSTFSLEDDHPDFFDTLIGPDADGLRVSHASNDGFDNSSPRFPSTVRLNLADIDPSNYRDLSLNLSIDSFDSSWFFGNAVYTIIEAEYTVSMTGIAIPEPSSAGYLGFIVFVTTSLRRRISVIDS